MGKAALDWGNVKVRRVTIDVDWSDKETVQQVQDDILAHPGTSIHGSLQCKPWSTWQYINEHKHGPSFKKRLAKARRDSISMLESFLATAALALECGGDVSFEWPHSCLGWKIPILLDFIKRHNLYTATADGCSLGMTNNKGEPILKRWRFVTSNRRLYEALSQFKC